MAAVTHEASDVLAPLERLQHRLRASATGGAEHGDGALRRSAARHARCRRTTDAQGADSRGEGEQEDGVQHVFDLVRVRVGVRARARARVGRGGSGV